MDSLSFGLSVGLPFVQADKVNWLDDTTYPIDLLSILKHNPSTVKSG